MFQCSQCKELIGENADQCPFCKHMITAQERKSYFESIERMRFETTQKAMDEYMRRVKVEILMTIAYVLSLGIGVTAIALLNGSEYLLIIMMVAVSALYLFVSWKLRVNRCPHCEEFMGRGLLWRSHCPRCGGQLR